MKKQYIGGNYLNSGAWTVCRFKKGLDEKGGGMVFFMRLILFIHSRVYKETSDLKYVEIRCR